MRCDFNVRKVRMESKKKAPKRLLLTRFRCEMHMGKVFFHDFCNQLSAISLSSEDPEEKLDNFPYHFQVVSETISQTLMVV